MQTTDRMEKNIANFTTAVMGLMNPLSVALQQLARPPVPAPYPYPPPMPHHMYGYPLPATRRADPTPENGDNEYINL